METTIHTIHVDSMGCYHPNPTEHIAWSTNDTRGYADGGPSCDQCGACECDDCHTCEHALCQCECNTDEAVECIGLSFAYVCLDGGESLCDACAKKAGITIVPCDCE